MKQNQIKDLDRLTNEHMENIFNVYTDKDGMYYYNLLQTIEFPKNLPPTLFVKYTIQYDDTWPFISYKVFKTPNMWWLILLANGIQDPTNGGRPLVPGTVIKIPNENVVREIMNQITTQ